MSIRYVYPVSLADRDCLGEIFYSPILTLIFNDEGEWIASVEEAQILAKNLLARTADFLVEERFVVSEENGSFYYLPDRTNILANPYRYPVEIAYGFVVAPSECSVQETNRTTNRLGKIRRL
jgi:hypothetical protein